MRFKLWHTWPRPPRRASLAAWVAVGILSAVVPSAWFDGPRAWWHSWLTPAQRTAASTVATLGETISPVRSLVTRARKQAELEAELAAAVARNQQLEAAVWQLHDRLTQAEQAASSSTVESTSPLVTGRLVEARVLGAALGPWLMRQPILDLPRGAWYEPGHPVVDAPPPVLDVGSDHQLDTGLFAVVGRRVWGKLIEVRGQSAMVQPTTDPGFRDVVYLARSTPAGLQRGPQGLWQGDGNGSASIRMIPVTETVGVGDLVLADNHRPAADSAWLYGHVVQVERPQGATHWQIRVQPAASGEPPDRLAVFVPRIHPERLTRALDTKALE